MALKTFENSSDDLELLQFYPTIIYHSIMQGNGNNCNIIFDEDVLNQHTLINADEEEKSKYPNVKFGESCGKILLHKDYRFNAIFQEIIGHLKLYLEGVLYIKPEMFDMYVIRSWYNILYFPEYTGFKSRGSSDISFVYYPKVDDATPYFWVSNSNGDMNKVNEIFPHAFSENIKGKKFVRSNNYLNNSMNGVKPQEGSIILYPSSVPSGLFNMRDMSTVKSKEQSYIIQGEIKLTLKPNIIDVEDGLISIDHWKKFNS